MQRQPICGRRHIKPIEPKVRSRVVGGYEVYPPHSQPWMVAFANASRHFTSCGGTLIHPSFVISAMHCFWFNEKSMAVLGLHDKARPEYTLQWINIKNRYADPRNDWPESCYGLSYDVVMLELEKPAKLGTAFPNVALACLGESIKTYDGYLTYTMGWGQQVPFWNESSLPPNNNRLQLVKQQIIPP